MSYYRCERAKDQPVTRHFPKTKASPDLPVSRGRAAFLKTCDRRDESRLRMRAYTESALFWQGPSGRKLRGTEMTRRKFPESNLPSHKKARQLM